MDTAKFKGLLTAAILIGVSAGCQGRIYIETKSPSVQPLGKITVSGDVENTMEMAVPEKGTTLRSVVESASLKNNAGETKPGSTFVQFARADEEYYVALSLVKETAAGEIRIFPNQKVKIVPWEKTALAKGLKEVQISIDPRPAKDDNLLAAYQWILSIFPHRGIPIPKADPQLTPEGFTDFVKKFMDDLEEELESQPTKLDLPLGSEAKTEESRKTWISTRLIPYFSKIAAVEIARASRENRLKMYEPDWGYLKDIYKNRPAAKGYPDELEPISAALFSQTTPVPKNISLLNVILPISKNGKMMNASHPSIESLLTQLTEFPEVGTGIVRVVRTINGKRTEFILELITQQATWGLSNRNQEQDYHRLHEMLIFDDDLIEVTTLHRVRPVLEDLVRSILEQEANSGKR